ncbi:unnamed protein product [Allacma fusca]|uniref:Uncharacterized protein n=1 Tax=Allacma fusca TaxID=39272 RepID=A0A8J2JKD8_9HEXA|nr:unnamed protein product [Allacma fusca]
MNKYIALTFLTALVAIAIANIFGVPGAHANIRQLSFLGEADWDRCIINFEAFSEHVASLQESTNRQSIFACQDNLQEVQESFANVMESCLVEIMADRRALGES